MSQSQIESLDAYIRQCLPEQVLNGFSCIVNKIKLEPAFKNVGNGQLRTALIYSTALLDWHNFPYRECPTALVYSAICIWISEQQNELFRNYDLEPPTVNFKIIDDKTATFSIEVNLIDEIFIIPDENGMIITGECRYRVADPIIHYIDSAVVSGLGAKAPV